MRTSVCVIALLLLSCNAEASNFDEALNAYSQNNVAEAERALRRIATDPAAGAKDKASALRELARIKWHIDGNAATALHDLSQADATGGSNCDSGKLRARILQESGRARELLDKTNMLAAQCKDAAEAGLVQLDAAEAALDIASADAAARAGALARAKELLGNLHPDVRASLRASALALQLGLLVGDSAAALQAWKDYFWLTETDVPQGLKHPYRSATELFGAGLSRDAAPEARLQLVDLLVRAGFASAAERFAAINGLPGTAAGHPLWRKAAGYFQARKELQATIVASNRRVARGGKADNLKGAVAKAQEQLMAAAGLRGDPQRALLEAYGLSGQVGDTDGYASVHFGHVVQSEQQSVEQYGHHAAVAFLALDNMISNGFNSWLWDGRAAAGGWTSPGPLIVQVRPEWTSAPLSAWSLFNGGSRRERLTARQAERMASDLAAVRDGSVVYLPGLADRLAMQVAQQVGGRARQLAGRGGDIRRAFLAEYWRANFKQSIVGHEGRHALDRGLVRGLARLSDSNLEYRAKLSELAFADYPRLAFNNINEPSLGDDSAHGKANERMLRQFADWIAKHSGQVQGYDPALPAVVQIDRLTDAQMRAIARSLDPIAK
jgi:hypothetical protein